MRHRSYKATQKRRAHGEREAERPPAQGLAAAGLNAQKLADLAGSEARKGAIAGILWENATVSMHGSRIVEQ
jgi:hypothetical protein